MRSKPRMPGWFKLDRLLRVRGLGARHNSLVFDSPSALPRDNRKPVSYWRASETLSGVYKFELVRYIYICICMEVRMP